MDVQERTGLVITSNPSAKRGESSMSEETLTSLHYSLESPLGHSGSAQFIQQLRQDLSQILLTSPDSETALFGLATSLGQALAADACVIGMIDRGQTIAQHRSWSVHQGTTAAPHSLQQQTALLQLLQHPAIAYQFGEAMPLAIADLSIIPDLPELPSPAKAVLAIKTVFQGKINGIVVLTHTHPHAWTELEIQSMGALSDQIAIAIAQAQLERQVQQQGRFQALLDHLSGAIRSIWETDQIFQLALSGAVSALGVSRGFVLLLKYSDPLFKSRSMGSAGAVSSENRPPKARAIVECQYPGVDERYSDEHSSIEDDFQKNATLTAGNWLRQSFSLSECCILRQIVLAAGKAIALPTPQTLLNDVISFLPGQQPIAPIFDLAEMPSLLVMPLENQGTILGCLVLQHEVNHVWQSEEIAFVKLVAAQLSTAIIQTRTLRQVQALVDERTAQLQRSLDVQAKLYEKTRQQVSQLRHLNEIMSEFLSTVSHELLTPLTSMTVAIRMLRDAKLTPEQQAKYLDILERQCAQETNLINDLLALQRLESQTSSARLQPIDIKYPIRDLARSFEENWAKKELTLAVELPAKPLNLSTDPDSFNRILTELLTNAGKYADRYSTIRLKVVHEVNQHVDQMVLTLCNVGAGISQEEMPYIFDRFRRGKGVTQQAIPGTGLGLALVKGLVEHLSGAIAVSSTPLEGSDSWETCFTLTLPQSPGLLF